MLSTQAITRIGPYETTASKVRIGLSLCPFIGVVMNIFNQPYFLCCCIDSPMDLLRRKATALNSQIRDLTDNSNRLRRSIVLSSADGFYGLLGILASVGSMTPDQIQAKHAADAERQKKKEAEAEENVKKAKENLDAIQKIQTEEIPKLEAEIILQRKTERVYSLCCLGSALSTLAIVVTLVALHAISMSAITISLMVFLATKILSAAYAARYIFQEPGSART